MRAFSFFLLSDLADCSWVSPKHNPNLGHARNCASLDVLTRPNFARLRGADHFVGIAKGEIGRRLDAFGQAGTGWSSLRADL